MENKFLYINEGGSDGTLLAEDGGVAIIWHNGEHLVGQCYRERLNGRFLKKDYAYAFEKMVNDSSNSSLFDFENEDDILPSHLQEMADWLIAGREGEFFENLTYLKISELNEKEIDEKVKEFLKNVKQEYAIDTYRVSQHEGTRIVDCVELIEEPKKYAKKALVYSSVLQANVLVFRNDLK
ncbi:MAG TPA: hypothetical protein VIH28_07110 [Ignavibacteriaceae bacterium]